MQTKNKRKGHKKMWVIVAVVVVLLVLLASQGYNIYMGTFTFGRTTTVTTAPGEVM